MMKKSTLHFGGLSLNLDTLRRLDTTRVHDAPQLGDKPKDPPKSMGAECPPSTKTRVTAHCC
ncbi:MAG TPA: hypothetical protein VHC69_30550 [Polyangiaceae bacterium]|nr:hypothetical protein [Polyangiaceae bacterium]